MDKLTTANTIKQMADRINELIDENDILKSQLYNQALLKVRYNAGDTTIKKLAITGPSGMGAKLYRYGESVTKSPGIILSQIDHLEYYCIYDDVIGYEEPNITMFCVGGSSFDSLPTLSGAKITKNNGYSLDICVYGNNATISGGYTDD